MGSRPELKVDDESGFISFFNRLPETDAIRVFERNDFYSVHGHDAVFVATTVYKTTSILKQLGSSRNALESCTMSPTVFRGFLREVLFMQGKRIEIWQQKGKGPWEIAKQASPGNLQDVEEDFAGQLESAPILVAVKIQVKAEERTVGVCFADASARELGVSEFPDNEVYSNLESLLIQLGAKECVIQENIDNKDPELKKVSDLIDRCGIVVTFNKSSHFTAKDIEQDLSRLMASEGTAGILPFTEHKLAMSAASAMIRYLSLMADELNFGQYKLYQHDLSQYMRLDASAVRALNLIPGPRDGSKNMSLYGLLNKCKTAIGTRLLGQWLKQPLMGLEDIERRHSLVEAFVEDTDLRQTMQEEHLKKIPDLYRLSKRFKRKIANLEDVVRAYQVAITLPGFIGTLEAVMDEKYKDPLDEQYTNKLCQLSSQLEKLQELVETTVDLDAIDEHEFKIKPEFNEDLQSIKQRLDDLKNLMSKEHRRASSDLGQEMNKKLFLENHKTHGWCFRLTRNEAGCIRNSREYKEIMTQKTGVYFTTDTLRDLNRESDQASQAYERTQKGLVNEVVSVAESYCPVLEELASVIAHLDVIVSFAHVSVHAPTAYVRPKMHPRGQGDTVLKEARHPCMEMQDDIQFITNDVSLKRGSSEFLIITGPNMGGKSTYIRQIGVIALMAQVGCFVPCSEAELTVFDCILARVGASDSQLKGVSTFMAEMLETATILKSASSESLIIIDELGRGTSTYDGFGLAWAISEHIVKEIRCFALFATHFHELTALNEQYLAVKNLHVVAHIGDRKEEGREVTLLYKVEDGVCDQSFGIHVAELVKFPQKVVKMAKRKADELEDFTGKHGEHHTQCTKEEIAQGSAILKKMLLEWKQKVSGGHMTPAQMKDELKALAQGPYKQAFEKDPFFQSVKTLA
ncbi:muts domain V-domain-containing protein [Sphaerosporella brunnea]|uniref:Muts domain V-domain-containing protein n=1 Tax=Sphaerosporella brunnea TaxID=1250544 RepID=A0A5J5EPA4_9PEZI|nr:muts domain V-domain-containing protein [Sphaerosporella brunnea]